MHKKKRDFSIFKFVERPLNIFCQAKSFARSLFDQKEQNFRVRLKIKKLRSNLGHPNVYVNEELIPKIDSQVF